MIENPLKLNDRTGEKGKDRLFQLHQLLKQNQQIQQSLKKTRDTINERMQGIDEFISTYRLKTEYPNATALLSFIKFERNLPQTLIEQNNIIQTEVFKATHEENFFDKLNNKKSKDGKRLKKKKQVDFTGLPRSISEINFQKMAQQYSYSTGIEFYREWRQFNMEKQPKMPYMLEEERIIIEQHKKYGNCWEKICQFLGERLFDEIYYEYHNRLNPRIQNGRWTFRQSLMLVVLLEHFGVGRWSVIGDKMVTKSELQVRERYCNMIDPLIGKDTHWTPEMDEKLLVAAPQLEFCWYKISKIPIFKNKTDNCVWRRYRTLLTKRPKEEIVQLLEGSKKGLAHKIIKYKEVYDGRNRKPTAANKNAVFDPNQRARSNRQNLTESMRASIMSVNSDLNFPPASNQSKSEVSIENHEESLQYIHYE